MALTRCLFLLAADAGDYGRAQRATTTKSSSDGNFGGWDVVQGNLEVALRELHEWGSSVRTALDNTERLTEEGGGDLPAGPKESPLHPFRPITSKRRSFHEMSMTRTLSSPMKNFLEHSTHSILGLASKFNSSHTVDNLSDSGAAQGSFFEPMIYQIQSSRQRLNQTQNRYIRMVYAHEMLHLVKDEKHLQQDDEYYLHQNRETFGSLEKLERIRRHSIDGEDEGGEIWMNPHPTVSRLSKILNLASAGLYMCG